MLISLQVSASVKSGENPNLSKKERKASKVALKRIVNYYSWYLNYINTNHVRPTQHVVLNQNVSANMRRTALGNNERYDVFLASSNFDPKCDIVISPEKIEKNRINMKAVVTGKYNYTFHVDMIIQKDFWCIDLVVGDEDMDPRIESAQ